MKYYTIPSYLLYGLVIGIILISGIFFFAMQDANKCLGNPLVYGAKKAVSDESGPVICSCTFQSTSYVPFYFDENGMSVGRYLIE